jgi:Loader and inhibitor of phage G40P
VTRSEWTDIVAGMRGAWPHAAIPDVAIAKWYDDLRDLDAEVVAAAVEAHYRDGRDFPPNGGQIRLKAGELAAGERAGDWSRGYELAHLWDAPKGADSWNYHGAAALEWLRQQDPIAAEVVKRIGVVEWGERLASEAPIWRAQFRDIYRDIAERADRERRYAGLPRGGELRRLRAVPEAIEDGET